MPDPPKWSVAERRAHLVEPPTKVSDWAERHRVLSRAQTNAPGPLRNSSAPYLIGIMDALGLDGIEEIDVQKSAQIGVSEALRSWIGRSADEDPDPCLFVFPNESAGRKIIKRRITPLFTSTKRLRGLLTESPRDLKASSIELSNGFFLQLGFSGSPTSLKSDPQRRIGLDEVDDFAEFAGHSADPLSMAEKRTITYGDRRELFVVSTPTTENGVISRRRSSAPIQLRYFVPCPECGLYQELVFDRLKWEKPEGEPDREKQAAHIEAENACWYECRDCCEKIDNNQKATMVRRGAWATEDVGPRLKWSEPDKHIQAPDGTVWQPGGCIRVEWPAGRRIGFLVSALYCLWVDWVNIAGDWLRSQGDVGALMDFYNQVLGLPFKEHVITPRAGVFSDKSQVKHPPGIIPKWAGRLLATVDCQKDHFYLLLRAWGTRMRSRRILHQVVGDLEDVRRLCFGTVYPFEGETTGLTCDIVGIDRRYEPERVDRFCRTDSRLTALMGEGKPLKDWALHKQNIYHPPGHKRTKYVSVYHLIDTVRCKDWLAGAIQTTIEDINSETGEVTKMDLWELNSDNDGTYNKQMSSERKVLERRGNSRVEAWEQHGDNHYWDCEQMQRALAYIARVELLDVQATNPGRAARSPKSGATRQRRAIRRTY